MSLPSLSEAEFWKQARAIGYACACRFALTPEDREDCVQEFLARWLPFSHDLPCLHWPQAQRSAYLHRCASNHCANFVRALCRRSQRAGGSSASLCLASSYREPDLRGCPDPDPAHAPEAALFQKLFWEEVGQCARLLSGSGWHLFVAHYLDGKRIVDLAQASNGRSAHALRQSLLHLRKRLRTLLLGNGVDETELRTYLRSCLPERILVAQQGQVLVAEGSEETPPEKKCNSFSETP